MQPFIQKALSTDSTLSLDQPMPELSDQGLYPVNFAPDNIPTDGSIKSVDSIEITDKHTVHVQKIAEKLRHTLRADVDIVTHTDSHPEDEPNRITDLPEELLLGIFQKSLTTNDLANVSQVNKKWNRIARDNTLWRPKLVELAKKHQLDFNPDDFRNFDNKTIYQRLQYILSAKDTSEAGIGRSYLYHTYLKKQLDVRFVARYLTPFSEKQDMLTSDTPPIILYDALQIAITVNNIEMIDYLLSLTGPDDQPLVMPDYQILKLAIEANNVALTDKLLSLTKENGDALFAPHYEMLYCAIDQENIDVTKYLLSRTGADGSHLFIPDSVILNDIIERRNIEFITRLFSLTDADGNPYVIPGNWMLEAAADRGDIDVTKYLLSLTDEDGNPIIPLEEMLHRVTAKVGTELLGDAFFRTNTDDNSLMTPDDERPDIPINRGKSECIKYLLSLTDASGSPLMTPDIDELKSALFFAIYIGDTDLVDDLLSKTDPNDNSMLTIDERAIDCTSPHDINMFRHLLTVTDKDGSFLLTIDAIRKINLKRCSPIKAALIEGLCDGSIHREMLCQNIALRNEKVDTLLNGNSDSGITPEDSPSLNR